jgi:hypothetical protein
MLPYLNEINKSKVQTVAFRGYNHNDVISEGEMYDMSNLTSDLYPILSTRKKRGESFTLTVPNGLCAKEELAWVDGTQFKYNGVIRGYVTDSKKKFYMMGAYIIIMPDKKFYNISTEEFGSLESSFTGTGAVSTNTITAPGIGAYFKPYDGINVSGCATATNNKSAVIISIDADVLTFANGTFTAESSVSITVSRTMPDIDFMTENENRLWGCSSANREVYASKLGDPTNWKCFEGISTDSYALVIGSDGEFTGAITHLGYVIFFKEHHIHKLMGTKPSNYQLYDTQALGVAKGSENSLVNINGVLFYNTINGIAAYQGSLPEIISEQFGEEKYSQAHAGHYNSKYYVSLKNVSNEWSMFAYDALKGLWHKEDSTNAEYFTELDGMLYYIDVADSKVKTIEGTDESSIEWSAEFGDFDGGVFNHKYISKIVARYELEVEKTMSAYIKYDSVGDWQLIKTITAPSTNVKRKQDLFIIPHRCDHFRIKLTGTGETSIYSLLKYIANGSDK